MYICGISSIQQPQSLLNGKPYYRVKLTTSNQRVGLDDSDANRHASSHQSLFNARDSGVDGIKLTAFRLDLQLQQLPALPPAIARVTDGSRCIYKEESMRLMQRQMLITPSKRESSALVLVLFKLVCASACMKQLDLLFSRRVLEQFSRKTGKISVFSRDMY